MTQTYRSRALLFGLLLGSSLVGPASVFAQEAPPPAESAEISLDTLLDIVVTATLREQTTLDAPSSIIVVNADEIKARGYRTIKQMLNDVPGFNDTSDVNEELGAVRGVYASSTNHILTLVNGHRMNDLMLGRYNLDQYLGIDTIERVEFIRGPASALYGTGALVAAINIITKKGSDVNGSILKGTAGPYSTEASATWGRSIEGYDVFFNFTYMNAVGQKVDQPASLDLKGPGPLNRPASDGQIYLGRYSENMSGLFTVRGDSSTLQLRAAHFRRVTPRGSNGSFYDYDKEAFKPTYTENDFFADYKYEWKFGDKNKLTINPSIHFFSYYEQSFITFGSNDQPPLGSRSGMLGEFNDYQMKVHFERQVLDSLNIILGGDTLLASFYRADAWSINGGGTSVPQVLMGNAPAVTVFPNFYAKPGKWLLSGAFLQSVWNPVKEFTLTLGGRLDNFQGRADSKLTPRVGLVYKPLDTLAIKLLYGQSYLAPMWAHTQANDGNFFGNPNLKPETFENTDLIIAYGDKKYSASIDMYYNYFTGLINSVKFDPASPNLQYRNAGDAVYLGADMAADAKILPWLRVNAAYSIIVPNTTVPESDTTHPEPDPRDASKSIQFADRARRGTSPQLLVYDYETGKKKIKDIPTHTIRYGVRFDLMPNLTISLFGRAYMETWTTDSVTTYAASVPAGSPAGTAAVCNATDPRACVPGAQVSGQPKGTNTLPKISIPAVALFDAAINYNWQWLTLQVLGTNLTNRAYEVGGSVPRQLRRQGINVEGSLAVKW
jgi:outer membrane receptor protein involved in Fe transport